MSYHHGYPSLREQWDELERTGFFQRRTDVRPACASSEPEPQIQEPDASENDRSSWFTPEELRHGAHALPALAPWDVPGHGSEQGGPPHRAVDEPAEFSSSPETVRQQHSEPPRGEHYHSFHQDRNLPSNSTLNPPNTHGLSMWEILGGPTEQITPKSGRAEKAAKMTFRGAVLVGTAALKLARKTGRTSRKLWSAYQLRQVRKAEREREAYRHWVASGCPRRRPRFAEESTAFNPSPYEWHRVAYDSGGGWSIFLNRDDHKFYKQFEGGDFHMIQPRDYDIDPGDHVDYMR